MLLLNIKKLCIIAGTILCTGAAMAQPGTQKQGVFYAVTGKGLKDTSYLFGTYHLVRASYLNNLPVVTAALQKSTNLVVEVVMDSAAAGNINAFTTMQQGKSLKMLVGDGIADTLDKSFQQSMGVGIAPFNNYKPAMAMLTLAMAQLMKDNGDVLGKYTGLPLDAHFADVAKKSGKNITPLETIEGQMKLLFNSSTEEEQAATLTKFIRNNNEERKLAGDMLNAYFSDGLDDMYKVSLAAQMEPGENERLIDDRNRQWLQRLPAVMASQPSFIAVGALHLAGPQGLVAQLRAQGYQVTPIKL